MSTKQDIWATYDPEKVRAGLQKSAGALKGVASAALKRDIRDQRGQESHGRPTEQEYLRSLSIPKID